MQQKKKSHPKARHELAAWLNKQSPKKLRKFKISLGIASAVLAYPMIMLALWFFQEITLRTLEGGTSFNLFEWVAPLGFIMAPVAAILGAFLIGRRNERAARILMFAVTAAVVGFATLGVYILLSLDQGGYFNSMADAFMSLSEYGRIGVGPVGISLPATLLIVIVIIVLSSGEGKRSK